MVRRPCWGQVPGRRRGRLLGQRGEKVAVLQDMAMRGGTECRRSGNKTATGCTRIYLNRIMET